MIRVRCIVDHAADVFGTTAKDILSPSRFNEHVIARRAVSLASINQGWSFAAIGRVLGRNPKTVAYSRDIALRNMQSDPAFCAKIAELDKRVAA